MRRRIVHALAVAVAVASAAAVADVTKTSIGSTRRGPATPSLGDSSKESAMANGTVYDRAGHDIVWAGDSTADFRARMASRRAEALEHWRKELAEQSSVLNSPSDRIRVWERRHQIDLPRD